MKTVWCIGEGPHTLWIAVLLCSMTSAAISSNLAEDLSNWMRDLPVPLHKIPINQLIIPGSHDSLSFSLNPKEGLAPDNEQTWALLIKILGGPLAKRIVYQWSLTQVLNTTSQLEAGIRYFDIRLAVKPTADGRELLAVHGLYGETVEAFLEAMKSFLSEHPKEIVLLHFQHLYDFKDDDHQSLLKVLTSYLGPLMVQYTAKLSNLTLESVWSKEQQVIAFYDHPSLGKYHPFLWPTSKIPNPWPNKDDVKSLLAFWDLYVDQGHDEDEFCVFQGVGTPQVPTIVLHATGSLRSTIVSKVNQALLGFLQNRIDKHNYVSKINVIMFDFINIETPKLASLIVNMNNAHLAPPFGGSSTPYNGSGVQPGVLSRHLASSEDADLSPVDSNGGTTKTVFTKQDSVHVTIDGVSINSMENINEQLMKTSVTADSLSENLKELKFADE